MNPDSDPQVGMPPEQYAEYLRRSTMRVVAIPLKTVSETNRREHWAAKADRAKAQRTAARVSVQSASQAKLQPGERYRVAITRLSPRLLDTGNLGAALKAVQDGVADALGVDDGPKAGHVWTYGQDTTTRKSPYRYAVSIAICKEPRPFLDTPAPKV